MARRNRLGALAGLIALAAAGYAGTGIHFIGQDEVGVVRRFGKLDPQPLAPGICFRPPWPLETVAPVRVTDVKTVAVGFNEIDDMLGYPAKEADSQLLTGDTNIVQLQAWVHYQVSDPVALTAAAGEPQAFVRHSAESVLALEVAAMTVDDVLTSGRQRLEEAAQRSLQHLLDLQATGLLVLAVKIKHVDPPPAAQAAFNDVTSAKADQSRLMHEAHEYRNKVLPRARGEAAAAGEQAAAYARETTMRAEGEANRFDALRAEYAKAPAITRSRLYWETLSRALRLCRIITVPREPGGRVTFRSIETRFSSDKPADPSAGGDRTGQFGTAAGR